MKKSRNEKIRESVDNLNKALAMPIPDINVACYNLWSEPLRASFKKFLDDYEVYLGRKPIVSTDLL